MFNCELLRRRRKEMGLTMLELSRRINEHYTDIVLDMRTYQHWESYPTSNPRRHTLEKVCDYMDLKMEDLFITDTNIEKVLETEFAELIFLISRAYKRNPSDKRIRTALEMFSQK